MKDERADPIVVTSLLRNLSHWERTVVSKAHQAPKTSQQLHNRGTPQLDSLVPRACGKVRAGALRSFRVLQQNV